MTIKKLYLPLIVLIITVSTARVCNATIINYTGRVVEINDPTASSTAELGNINIDDFIYGQIAYEDALTPDYQQLNQQHYSPTNTLLNYITASHNITGYHFDSRATQGYDPLLTSDVLSGDFSDTNPNHPGEDSVSTVNLTYGGSIYNPIVDAVTEMQFKYFVHYADHAIYVNNIETLGDASFYINNPGGSHPFPFYITGDTSTGDKYELGIFISTSSVVPEPTTIALLGIGLVGLAGAEVRRRRRKKTVDNS